jgi:flagellar protein FliL
MSLMTSLYTRPTIYMLFLLCGITSIVSHAEEALPSAYIELKPDFVVNHLGSDARLKYIKTAISIRTDKTQKTLIEENMPLVRDALVMFLSSRTTDQVTGAIAREKTREEAAIAVNNALQEETGLSPIKDILFASFVTQ